MSAVRFKVASYEIQTANMDRTPESAVTVTLRDAEGKYRIVTYFTDDMRSDEQVEWAADGTVEGRMVLPRKAYDTFVNLLREGSPLFPSKV